ncbi:hypothetical protein [Streptobacillus moniliformis]|uniref:hypothetical protein n=1 Tax=Streptobacillus moniliformis TaxID=34105 RepID=UPI0007E48724|nr:hypothetical protein [Streptobacillus moniliformis]
MEEKVEFLYSGAKIAKELNMSLKKFLSLVEAGVYDFVKVEKLDNGKRKFHYDVVKVMKYLNDFKEEKIRSKQLIGKNLEN